tara:strand:- start:54 stop:728 length:675 start_codon:yes stop_codon:yes gene_type:complete
MTNTHTGKEVLSGASEGNVQDILESARGPRQLFPDSKRMFAIVPKILSDDDCTRLISFIDEQWSMSTHADKARDFKLEVDAAHIAKVINQSIHSLRSFVDAQEQELLPTTDRILKIKIRRRAATTDSIDEVIPFHRDHSRVVLNMKLNDNFEGAQLIFVTPDGLIRPLASVGGGIFHDCRIVHGVTQITAGVRYNIYVLYKNVKPNPLACTQHAHPLACVQVAA